MISHTPQFNQLIDEYYSKNPEKQIRCQESGELFLVIDREYGLYKKLGLPLPAVAPWVRFRRQRAAMGGIELFRRELPGEKPLISMYDPESPAVIWPTDKWYSDEFDAANYARTIDPKQSFFYQWQEFSRSVPRPAIIHDANSVNSDYAAYDLSSRDCYFMFGGVGNDGVVYGDMCVRSKQSCDVTSLTESEWCYESVQCYQCSRTHYSERCDTSFDLYFCFGVSNSSDCFGCFNLKNKKYCFFNEQLTEVEYKKRLSNIDLSDANQVAEWSKKAKEFWKSGFRCADGNFISEDVDGDDLVSCKDVIGVSIFESSHVYHGFDVAYCQDSLNLTTSSSMERSANSVCATSGFENKMSSTCESCIDVEYSELCYNVEHCFGCIGLRHKKFCIFNKQYTEEEYWLLVDVIKSEMLKRGEYGNFFPYRTSLFAYNASHADALYPLSVSEIENLGGRIYTFPTSYEYPVLAIAELPERLVDVTDEVVKQWFICPETKRSFRITAGELAFHRKMNLALPRVHPSVRRKERYRDLLPFHLFPRECMKCEKMILARVDVADPMKLYCGECYVGEMVG